MRERIADWQASSTNFGYYIEAFVDTDGEPEIQVAGVIKPVAAGKRLVSDDDISMLKRFIEEYEGMKTFYQSGEHSDCCSQPTEEMWEDDMALDGGILQQCCDCGAYRIIKA